MSDRKGVLLLGFPWLAVVISKTNDAISNLVGLVAEISKAQVDVVSKPTGICLKKRRGPLVFAVPIIAFPAISVTMELPSSGPIALTSDMDTTSDQDPFL